MIVRKIEYSIRLFKSSHLILNILINVDVFRLIHLLFQSSLEI